MKAGIARDLSDLLRPSCGKSVVCVSPLINGCSGRRGGTNFKDREMRDRRGGAEPLQRRRLFARVRVQNGQRHQRERVRESERRERDERETDRKEREAERDRERESLEEGLWLLLSPPSTALLPRQSRCLETSVFPCVTTHAHGRRCVLCQIKRQQPVTNPPDSCRGRTQARLQRSVEPVKSQCVLGKTISTGAPGKVNHDKKSFCSWKKQLQSLIN